MALVIFVSTASRAGESLCVVEILRPALTFFNPQKVFRAGVFQELVLEAHYETLKKEGIDITQGYWKEGDWWMSEYRLDNDVPILAPFAPVSVHFGVESASNFSFAMKDTRGELTHAEGNYLFLRGGEASAHRTEKYFASLDWAYSVPRRKSDGNSQGQMKPYAFFDHVADGFRQMALTQLHSDFLADNPPGLDWHISGFSIRFFSAVVKGLQIKVVNRVVRIVGPRVESDFLFVDSQNREVYASGTMRFDLNRQGIPVDIPDPMASELRTKIEELR